ncbi:MAG: hypothetical protein AAGC92_02540 [Pseudomonadota bacterium]
MPGQDRPPLPTTRFSEFDATGGRAAASPGFLEDRDPADFFRSGFEALYAAAPSAEKALARWHVAGAVIEAGAYCSAWVLFSSHPNASGGPRLICTDIARIRACNALSRILIKSRPLPIVLHDSKDGLSLI